MYVVEFKVLLLKMLSGMSYVLGLEYVVFDVQVCAGTDSRMSDIFCKTRLGLWYVRVLKTFSLV
jgi:hypothetical protein